MTTFDDRLAAQLRALDSAIPTQAPPDPVVARGAMRNQRTRPSRGVRRGLVVLAAAVALLVGTTVVTGGRMEYPGEQPEPELEAALAQMVAARECLSPEQAEAEIPTLLASLGYEGWDVERTQAARNARCVATAVESEHHAIWLLPGRSQAEAEVTESLKVELMARCLARRDALELVRSALASVGVTDIEIRADPGGPQAYPVDQEDAWKQHVAQGCFVLSPVAAWDENGHKTLYLWGE
jgi:hypothetical protein